MATLPEVTAPPTFKDSQGRQWSINLTLGTINKVRDRFQVDLVVDGKDASAITGLLFDDRKLVSLLWFLVKKQAAGIIIPAEGEPGDEDYVAAHPMKEVDFDDGMDAIAINAGWGAIANAVIFFTRQKSPKLAEAFEKILEAEMRVIEAGAAEMLATLDSPEVDEQIRRTAAKIGEQMKRDTVKQLASFATDSGAS